MDFFVGDETGQLKYVTVTLPDDTNAQLSSDEHDETNKRRLFKKEQPLPRLPKSTLSKNIWTISNPTGKQNRLYSITSLDWSKRPRVDLPCEKGFLFNERLLPLSQQEIVVGRKNGLVEAYPLESSFNNGPNSSYITPPLPLKRFHMSSPIVLASSCGSSSSSNFVCLTECGKGAIVNWENSSWESTTGSTNSWPSLSNISYPDVWFGKSRRGRILRSDGAHPELSSPIDIELPLISPRTTDTTVFPWLDATFQVPGPIECAALNPFNSSTMAFAGDNNLLKLLDLATMVPIFSAKNVAADALQVFERIHVKALAFLDRLSFASSCICTGNFNGRLHVYDYRIQGKPVLDAKVCEQDRSVSCITTSPSFVLTPECHHCCSTDTDCSSPECICFTWNSKKLEKSLKKGAITNQLIAVGDNHGSVHMYDIRANSVIPTNNDDDSTISSTGCSLTKKRSRKWEPHKYGVYNRGDIISGTPSTANVQYTITPKHNLPQTMGGLSNLSWSSNESNLLGVSIGRHASIWSPNDKKTDYHVYLKNKQTACLWGNGYRVKEKTLINEVLRHMSDASVSSDSDLDEKMEQTHNDSDEDSLFDRDSEDTDES